MTQAKSTEKVVQEIRRKTRRARYYAGVEVKNVTPLGHEQLRAP